MDTRSKNEAELLQELTKYKIDSSPSESFDDFAHLALRIAAVQVVVIFFGGETRFIKGIAGDTAYPEAKTNLLCSLINQRNVYTEAEDLLRYDQFQFSSVLVDSPIVRFIGKEPIFNTSGIILGSICLMDERPCKMTVTQIQQLNIVSRLITHHLELMRQL